MRARPPSYFANFTKFELVSRANTWNLLHNSSVINNIDGFTNDKSTSCRLPFQKQFFQFYNCFVERDDRLTRSSQNLRVVRYSACNLINNISPIVRNNCYNERLLWLNNTVIKRFVRSCMYVDRIQQAERDKSFALWQEVLTQMELLTNSKKEVQDQRLQRSDSKEICRNVLR